MPRRWSVTSATQIQSTLTQNLISTLVLSFHNHHISSKWSLPFRCSNSKSECFYHPLHALLHVPPVASSPISTFLHYPCFAFALRYIFCTSPSPKFIYCSCKHILCISVQGITTLQNVRVLCTGIV